MRSEKRAVGADMEAGEVLVEPVTSKKTSKKQSKNTSTPSKLKVPAAPEASKVKHGSFCGGFPSSCSLCVNDVALGGNYHSMEW